MGDILKNPAVIVGAVIIGLFILLMRKGGGGSTAGLEYSIRSQEIATRGNVEAARINADVQKAGLTTYATRAADDYAFRLGIIDQTNRASIARRQIDSVERIAEDEINAKVGIEQMRSGERLALAEKHYAYQSAALSSSELIALKELESHERLQADANKYRLALPGAEAGARRELMKQATTDSLFTKGFDALLGGLGSMFGGFDLGGIIGGGGGIGDLIGDIF